MQKSTRKIKQNPSKYGIKITKEVLDSLDKGWSLLGTLAEINDISIFQISPYLETLTVSKKLPLR